MSRNLRDGPLKPNDSNDRKETQTNDKNVEMDALLLMTWREPAIVVGLNFVWVIVAAGSLVPLILTDGSFHDNAIFKIPFVNLITLYIG